VAEVVLSASAVHLNALGLSDEILTATPRSADGTALTAVLQWSSSDEGVVGVVPSGSHNEQARLVATGNGSATVTVTSEGVAGGLSVTVDQVAVGVEFVEPPRDALVGSELSPFAVAAVDAAGLPVGSATGPVSLDVATGPAGSLSGGPHVQDMDRGVATFSTVRLDDTGNFKLGAEWAQFSVESPVFDIVAGFDAVHISSHVTGSFGLTVDGQRSSGTFNDYAVVSPQATATLGVVVGPPSNAQVVVYAADGRTATAQARWTPGVDTLDIALEPALVLDATLWIVRGPFADQRGRALSAVQSTRTIWSGERAGLVLDSVEVVDATADPDAGDFRHLTLCQSKGDLEARIGHRPGRLNIYYVETVDGGTARGRACPIGGDHIIMAEASRHELLSHEIGHLLSLTHTDAIVQLFDRSNVMHSASSQRRYLTEGQVFRQQFDPNSVVNNLWAMRSSEARNCPRDVVNAECPAIELRLWSDGSFPPNFVELLPTGERQGRGPALNAERTQTGPVTGAAAIAARWVEVSCEMENNSGLSEALRAAGGGAVAALNEIALQHPDIEHRRAALDGLAVIGTRAAGDVLGVLELEPELAAHARAARQRMR